MKTFYPSQLIIDTIYLLKYVCRNHKHNLYIKYIFTFQIILGIYVIHVVFLTFIPFNQSGKKQWVVNMLFTGKLGK